MSYNKKRGSTQTNVRKKSEAKRVSHRSRLRKLGKRASGKIPGALGNKGV